MQIEELKINGFGKLEKREIALKKGINLIYGKNESGKSTLLKFIHNMFYGTSKNKKGREISDYDKFKPWGEKEFSGKIVYTLDNGEKYEVYREFSKKNPKIYNEKSEEISKQFTIDKAKGNDFFYEQTHVEEGLFSSSVMVMQDEVKLEKEEQNSLIQKIANLAGTGLDTVSYQRCMERISRKQLAEIGTNRSQDRPINKVMQKIKELENIKEELEIERNNKKEIDSKKEILLEEINMLENKNNLLKEIIYLDENEKIEKEKIKINEEIRNNYNKKINELNIQEKEIENKIELIQKNEKIKIEKINNKKYIILFILILIINIATYFFIKINFLQYAELSLFPILLLIYFLEKNKLINNNKNKIEEKEQKINKIKIEQEKINNEIKLIENNKKEKEEEIAKLKNNLQIKNEIEKEKIKNNYEQKIKVEEIKIIFNNENNKEELEINQDKLNNKKIEINKIIIEEKNINSNLDNLAKIEEELENAKEELESLQFYNNAIELAKEILTESCETMRENVTPKFTKVLSQTIEKISEGKYKKIKLNTEEGILVEKEDGSYVSADLLSTGTIDQMYLSLRLATIQELAKERIPIILDEAFAFFDEQRLKNILQYIAKEMAGNQVLILTCTQREMDVLDQLGVEYNKIELE